MYQLSLLTNFIFDILSSYYEIGTSLHHRLTMTNHGSKTCRTHKVNSLISSKYFPYAWGKNWTTTHMLKKLKTIIT